MNIQRTIGTPEPEEGASEYLTDAYAWANAQRDALERRDGAALDWDNLAEEIGDLALSQLHEVESRLATIIEHLLKYEYGLRRDPARGWKRTVVVQRTRLARVVKRNPSLASKLSDLAAEVYPDGRSEALASFEEHEPLLLDGYIARLPTALLYSVEELIDPNFMPEPRDGD